MPRYKRHLTPEQRTRREAQTVAKAAAAAALRAEYDRVEAVRTEAIAEAVVPFVRRAPITQGDKILRGPLMEVIGGRPQRVNLVAALVGQRGELEPSQRDIIGQLADRSPAITHGHLSASRRLQADWAEVGGGIGVRAMDYSEWTAGSGGSRGIHAADAVILGQIATRARLDASLAWMGALAGVVVAVVLDCVPVGKWGDAQNPPMREPHAVGFLAAALTRLVGFYESLNPRTLRRDGESGDDIRSLVDADVARRQPAFGQAEKTAKAADK